MDIRVSWCREGASDSWAAQKAVLEGKINAYEAILPETKFLAEDVSEALTHISIREYLHLSITGRYH